MEKKSWASFRNLHTLILRWVIVVLLAVLVVGEWAHFEPEGMVIKEAWFKYADKGEIDKLVKGEKAFSTMSYDAKLENREGFVVDGPVYGGRSNGIILHFSYLDTDLKTPVLHFKSIYGSKVWVFSEENRLIYYDDKTIQNTHSVRELSEMYLPFDVSGVNVLIEGQPGDHMLGIEGDVRLMSYQESLNVLFTEGYPRRVVGFFLMLAALSLFLIRRVFSIKTSKNLFEALGFFFGIFGMWIILDFGRYNLWILNVFHGLPPVILKVLYFFAMSFLNYSFSNLCYHMFIDTRFKRFLYWLRMYALVTGWLYFLFTTALLFSWTPWLYQLHTLTEDVNLGSVTIGSLLLLGVSLAEAASGKRKAVIFATGFGLCELTFIISQSTPILISHWGVLALVVTFAVILSGEFNEAQQANLLYTEELELKNQELLRLYSDLEGAQHEILYLLGSAVDLRSKETSNHVKRVAEYSRLFATKMGYGRSEADLVALASTLHDIGKVGISDTILNKAGDLTLEEYETMKQHALMGYDMLKESELELIRTAAIVAVSHHERFDGSGYPFGHRNDEIHPYGRIVAAADVLDALLSTRVYKTSWDFDQVLAYFKEQSGHQFDPAIVKILVEHASTFQTISETYV